MSVLHCIFINDMSFELCNWNKSVFKGDLYNILFKIKVPYLQSLAFEVSLIPMLSSFYIEHASDTNDETVGFC